MKTVIIKGHVVAGGKKALPTGEPHKCATEDEAKRLVSLGVAEWPEAEADVPEEAPPAESLPGREQVIYDAIISMLASDPKKRKSAFWDKEGKPLVSHLRKITKLSDVSGAERDEAWFSMPESKPLPPEGLTEERIELIRIAIKEMREEDPATLNETFWTSLGKPTDAELDRRIKGGVTAAERDWVLEQVIDG